MIVKMFAGLFFPFAFGWLLGHSIGNGVLLRLPIAPLLFRLLRYVLKYGFDLQSCHLHPYTLTLVDTKLLKSVEDLDDKKLRVLLEHAFETGVKNSAANVYALTTIRATQAVLMNIENNVEKSLSFWREVAEGFRITPLGNSPLLSNCCARVVRNVLCGVTNPDEVNKSTFCWEDHFIFLCTPKLNKLPYGMSLLKSLVKCLNANFHGTKARDALMFLTGTSLLPPTPFTECIFLTVSLNCKASFSNGCPNNDLSLSVLPPKWPGHHVLEISGPVERFLLAQHCGDSAALDLQDWRRLRASDRTQVLAAFQEAMKELLTTAIAATTTATTASERGVGAEGEVDVMAHVFPKPQREVKINYTSDSSDFSLHVGGFETNM